MKNKRPKRPRRLDYRVEIPFAVALNQLPDEQHPGPLGGRFRLTRRPPRPFHELDPTTDHWHRL